MKTSTLLLALIMITGCATSDGSGPLGPGTHEITRFSVLHEGPEIAATVAYSSGERSLGEEWLVLATEITAAREGGPIILKRKAISLRTPDGHRLALITQDEFRSRYPTFMIPVERTLANRPMLDRYFPSRDVPCGRWFFAAPPEVITYDEFPVSSVQICTGSLIFKVPGGVQPGRWRLIIELEESLADIPFELHVDE